MAIILFDLLLKEEEETRLIYHHRLFIVRVCAVHVQKVCGKNSV